MKSIYLDYAAATPLAPEVAEAMKPYNSDKFYNPSATYLAAKNVSADIEKARAKIAHWLGARPSEIVFTAGGTESNNLAIHGIMSRFPKANVLVSAIEHDAVLQPARKYDCRKAKVDSKGLLNLKSLEESIDAKTVLVSVMYANNEVGTIQSLKEVTKIIKSIRQKRMVAGNKLPIYLHTDACQAGSYLDLHASRLGVDLMTLNGGKIYGPKQSGVLFVRSGIMLSPLILGGGQEHGLRSGTENVANIIGFAEALELVQNSRATEVERLKSLQQDFITKLVEAIPDIVINGSLKQRLPNNIHITIDGQDNERIMMKLDELGVQCAVGSACSASNDEPSHVLKAMGISDSDAQSSLRFSMGRQTTLNNITTTVKALSSALQS